MTDVVDLRLESCRVPVEAGDVELVGELSLPAGAVGIVAFAHGSGSSHLSPRNRYVAAALNGLGLATLLIDLLSAQEEAVARQTQRLRFDIPMLSHRLVDCVDWLQDHPSTAALAIGCFGASTGAAAALVAATERPETVRAVVSRGGRPDLAVAALTRVRAPTLLIVGGRDPQVLRLNRIALAELHCVKKLTIVPGATHLFEEAGALEGVARHAGRWFREHLGPNGGHPVGERPLEHSGRGL